MSAKTKVNVVWFKCTDLRTHDHAALKAAHNKGLPVLHLYVFDPFWHAGKTRLCGYPKTGPIRNRFQLEAVNDVATKLAAAGHRLNVRTNISTKACFEELCQDFSVQEVFAFREMCSEELRIERQVRQVVGRSRGSLSTFWGFELYHHDDVTFDPRAPRGAFNSYTAFRKRVEEGSNVRPSHKEDPVFRGTDSVAWKRADAFPELAQLMGSIYDAATDPGETKDPRAELRWTGGETAALARVREFLWEEDSLGLDYVGATMTMDPSKSCMRDKAMSKFSPWLAHGCLSPRLLYEEVKRYEKERRKNKSTYWIVHELLWRDFVRFASIYAGTSIFKIGGPQNVSPSWAWSLDRQKLKAWTEGNTGFPFIDCFMRELKTTGYCNHMGRETAGWFLIADLGLDWRMAAEWFESVLIDYEPTANWYNWTYRCLPAARQKRSPGECLGSLEILKWGTQHDPDATYIKRWIPELQSLPSTVAREPWRLGLNGPGPASSASSGLRPAPTGQFSVSRQPLEALIAMGFDEKDAAIALFRTWEDPDAAAALLLSDGSHSNESTAHPKDVQQVDDSEDEELAHALALSLPGGPQTEAAKESKPSGFQYGRDYPKPMIQPVSLMHTEQAEAEARQQQSKRDAQIVAAKRHKGNCGQAGQVFRKTEWEQGRQEWPAETPTGAKAGWSGSRGDSRQNGYSSWQRRSRKEEQTEPVDKHVGGSGPATRRWGGRAMGG
eukprot:s181_g21.t1